MSQAPRNPAALEIGSPQAAIQRNTAPAVPRTQVAETVQAPGLVTTPPVSRGAQMMDQLTQAMGLAGQAAGQVGRHLDRASREAETFHRGQADAHARTLAPELLAKVEAGELDSLLDGDGTIAEAVDQYIDAELAGDDFPDAYRQQFHRTIAPRLSSAMVVREQDQKERARADLGQNAIDAATAAEDASGVRDALDAWLRVNPSATEAEAMASVVIPAARSAAQLGDDGRERLENLLGVMGDRFQADQRVIRDTFETTVRQQQRQADQDLQRRLPELTRDEPPVTVFAERLKRTADLDDGRLQDLVTGYARQRVQTEARLGQFDKIIELSDHLPDTRESRAFLQGQLEQARRFRLVDHFEQQEEALLDHATELMEQGDVTGGSVHLQDVTLIAPDGSDTTISRDDQIEAVRRRKWQQINEQYPRDTPDSAELNLNARLEFMRANPDVVDPELSATWSGLHQRVPTEAGEGAIPPAAVDGFNLYRQVKQTHPELLSAHADAEDLSFLRMADAIRRYSATTDAGALVQAAQAARTGGLEEARRVTGAELDRKVRSVTGRMFRDDVVNDADVRAELEQRARVYVATARISVDQALEKAREDFTEDSVLVNGRYVNIAGRQHTIGKIDDFDRVGRAVVNHYVERLGDDKAAPRDALDADAYTLVPDPSSNTWFVSWQGNGLPAEGARRYTDTDLAEINNALIGVDQKAASEAGVQRLKERLATQQQAAAVHMNQIARAVESHNVSGGRFNFDPDRFRVEQGPDDAALLEDVDPQPEPPQHLRSIIEMIRRTPDRSPSSKRARTRRIPHQRRPLPADVQPAGGMSPR